MDQKRINYIFSAVMVVLALILGWFGMTLPVQPEIPSPLPTPDLSGYVTAEELALVQRNIEALQVEGTSFTVSGDDTYSTACYQKQGGSEWIADDGCTWGVLDGGTLEIQSGATLDVQSGATVNLPSVSAGDTTITGNLMVSGTLGVVGAISNPTHYITIADHVDIQNTLNYGTANLYPLGSEDSNFQFSWGGQTITGTAALTTQKVGSPTAAWCTISSATFTATHCSTLIVGTTVTASVWISDGTASPVGVDVDWLVIGIP